MKHIRLSPYAEYALFVTAAAGAGLALLTVFCAAMVHIGSTPLQHFILTAQLAERIPETFFCGAVSVVLCELLERRMPPGSKQ